MMIETGPFAGLLRGGYRALVADPPWSFQSYTAAVGTRAAARHYRVMGLNDLMALPVPDLAARDSHLFLWTTGPHLPQALRLMTAWGFTYSSLAMTWIKLRRNHSGAWSERDLHLGLGYTFRKNSEIVLLGRRGRAKRLARDVPEVIVSPVREHSRKPDEAYARIVRYCTGPHIELFARERRPGWLAWGDQTDFFKGEAHHAGEHKRI